MSHDEILRKIVQLRIDKNWSEYRLSMETGIPQSTISSWFRKNVQPSVQSLAAICQACGITLSQFFSSDEDLTVELTVEQKDFLRSVFRFTFGTAKSLDCFLAHAESRPHRIKSLPHCGSSLFPRTGFLSDFRVFSEEKLKKEV